MRPAFTWCACLPNGEIKGSEMGPRWGLHRRPAASKAPKGTTKSEKDGKALRLMQLNCRSLLESGKRAEIARLAHLWNIDILCLQETHLPETDKSPTIESFTIVGRCDRQSDYSEAGGRGGGVATYQRAQYGVDLIETRCIQPRVESVTITIRTDRGLLKIANVYIPPRLKADTWFTSYEEEMIVADTAIHEDHGILQEQKNRGSN